jgi:two-component sensor histidine kinase
VYFVPAVAALLFLGSLAWRSHRDLEEKVELRTRALSEAVAEKNQLLKEVHHRVKNNMQIVSSLIRMQERVHTSPEETIRRVQAMALVHDLIYSHGEFASVNLGAYVRRLSEMLRGSAPTGTRVTFSHDLDHVAVTLDRAMPFALILSEVLTNAMRHAFPDGEGRIAITLDHIDGHAELRVEDDGQGFDRSERQDGFGLKLIRSLAVQLEADVRFEEGAGTLFIMRFPLAQTMHDA